MNDNLDIWVKISSQIGELNASIKSVLDNISNHEGRIQRLEHIKNTEPLQDNWKNDLLMLLAKALVIGVVSIASLAGASGILAKVFNI